MKGRGRTKRNRPAHGVYWGHPHRKAEGGSLSQPSLQERSEWMAGRGDKEDASHQYGSKGQRKDGYGVNCRNRLSRIKGHFLEGEIK